MTLPNVIRSASTGSRPYQPEAETRKPVSTSSMMRRAPLAVHSSRSSALNPGRGGTTPMLAGQASVITQAISSPKASKASVTASGEL